VSEANRGAAGLCASLRVQYGKISVGGSTQIGEPNNKVKGVSVGRGLQDITGNAVDVCTHTRGVCTEAIGGFDLSDPPAFPTLDGPGGAGRARAGAPASGKRRRVASASSREALSPSAGLP